MKPDTKDHVVGLHLQEMSGAGKSIDRKWISGCQGLGVQVRERGRREELIVIY